MKEVEENLRRVFGCPEAPSYKKIGELFSSGPNYTELKGIISRKPVMDVTEENYDFCYSFLIFFECYKVRVELSLVGPYACLMRIDEQNGISVIKESDVNSDLILQDIVDHLQQTRSLMPQELLENKIAYRLNILNDHDVFLYNGLFSLSPIPWISSNSCSD